VNALEIRGLTKAFGERRVLDGLSFSVGEGEVYGLLGPNGSGKTTTINVLCDLLAADAGTAAVSGVPAGEGAKRLMGFAPQEISIYRDLTCAENLDFFARLYGLAAAARRQRADDLIAEFRLGEYARTRVGALSGGWQRRINIAVALVHAPRLLVLDEPTAALDIEARHELWSTIERLHRAGTAILLTTHHLDEAERLCSRIGILHAGRIAVEGTLAELRATIPAQQLAVLETADEAAVAVRAAALGLGLRRYGGSPTLLLPRPTTLAELVGALSGVDVSSMALRPVGLEHVYLEVTQPAARPSGAPSPAPRREELASSGSS
jgi:ABC-2 type transport system ATP-binding protein